MGVFGSPQQFFFPDINPIDLKQNVPVQPGDSPLYRFVFGEHFSQGRLRGKLSCFTAQNNGVQGCFDLSMKGGVRFIGPLLQQPFRQKVDIGVRGRIQRIVAEKAENIGAVAGLPTALQKIPHGGKGL